MFISEVLLKLTTCYRFVPTLSTLIMNPKWFMFVLLKHVPCNKSALTPFTSKVFFGQLLLCVSKLFREKLFLNSS